VVKNKLLNTILCLVAACTIAIADSGVKNEYLAATINYLLAFVEKSDCIFIRNHKAHTAKEAVSHIKKKYDHFKDEIKTPEDFIRLSASKSLISGDPYMVKIREGRLMKSEVWLLEALTAYRQKQHGEPDGVSQ
jgi:hypothetical protein